MTDTKLQVGNVKRITETLELQVAVTTDDIFSVNLRYFDPKSEQKIKLLPSVSKRSYIWLLNLSCLGACALLEILELNKWSQDIYAINLLFVVSGELFGSFLSKANPNQAISVRINDFWGWINDIWIISATHYLRIRIIFVQQTEWTIVTSRALLLMKLFILTID